MDHIRLGLEGENIAKNHLINQGYEIVECNYKWKKGELDIICRKDDTLIIVEVKTRNSTVFGQPYQAVSLSKQRQIVRVSNHYIVEKQISEEVRFDVFSIVLNNHGVTVDHVKDAFYPLV